MALTALVGVGTLVSGTYRIATCFARPGYSGCSTVVSGFAPAALPAMLGPFAFFTGLTILAAVVWRSSSDRTAAVATTAFAALAASAILTVAPLLSLPVVLLVLASSLRARHPVLQAVTDLAIAGALTALAVASAYTLLLAAMLWRGGWLAAIGPAMWVYVALAAALAVGVGCAVRLRTPAETFPFARGALVAFGVCGAAGVIGLVFFTADLPFRVAAMRSLLMLGLVAVLLGAFALHHVLHISFRQALAGALAVSIAFPTSVGIAIGTRTPSPPSETSSSIGPPLPRVPWLPGTSTSPAPDR